MHNMFGFLPQRSTVLDLSLTHDVSEFFIALGSAVFVGSLDTEGTLIISHFQCYFTVPVMCYQICVGEICTTGTCQCVSTSAGITILAPV